MFAFVSFVLCALCTRVRTCDMRWKLRQNGPFPWHQYGVVTMRRKYAIYIQQLALFDTTEMCSHQTKTKKPKMENCVGGETDITM